ncbi:phage tail protein [Limnoraphis robusta Tam1]|uniref:phage tail protein n=1 Tax=Limnoraphis robusta TaxID=1118279 RepID=UPI002B208223|nr:phage tail protein [Limnoraphis robusta]MEA5540732.1 phage tail protein [Limnoraphis robusta Tam1]
MTQTNSRPTLYLRLTAMQLPDGGSLEKLALSPRQTEDTRKTTLRVYPGEPSEIILKLENQSEESLTLNLQLEIEPKINPNWCQWYQQSVNNGVTQLQDVRGFSYQLTVSPQQQQEIEIEFEFPQSFFEEQTALTSEQSKLEINYFAQLFVYSNHFNNRLIGYQVFDLKIAPRIEYLDFLPVIYSETDFLSRFFKILEETYDPAIQTTDNLWAYLDPLTAPEALLPFLAQWVGWKMDSRWPLDIQRRLIRNAIVLYRWHGTRKGLRFYLHLFTGLPLDEDLPEAEKHISIWEDFNRGFVLGSTHINQDSMLGGGRAYHFIVRLRVDFPNQIDEPLVREIIEQYKPAFSTYELNIIREF